MRRRPRHSGATMDAAQGIEPMPERRLASRIVHPARMSVEPDAEGFRQVHSCRRGRRRVLPRPVRPVPSNLIGLCFTAWQATMSRWPALSHHDASTTDVKATRPRIVLRRRLLGGTGEVPLYRIRSAIAVKYRTRGHRGSPICTSWMTRRLLARPPWVAHVSSWWTSGVQHVGSQSLWWTVAPKLCTEPSTLCWSKWTPVCALCRCLWV